VGQLAKDSAWLLWCHGVQGELDELEREEFFRLKKVQKNKQKNAARAAAEADAVSKQWVAFPQHKPAMFRAYLLVLKQS
jgi:hypothetical protein